MKLRLPVPIRLPLILLPALLVGGFEYVRHGLFEPLPTGLGNLAAAALAFFGSFVYYLYTFSFVQRANASLQQEEAQKAVLEERERIAGQLHDSMAQTLFFLNAQLERAASAFSAGESETAARLLREAQEGVQFAHQDLRSTITALRETQSVEPLASALHSLLAAWRRQTGIAVHLDLPDPLPGFEPKTQEAIVTFIREALTNVRKHAKAKSVSIRMAPAGDDLRLAVTDDGMGFDPTAGQRGFGLASLERLARRLGGTFHVESAPQVGTTLRLHIPHYQRFEREDRDVRTRPHCR